jgi:hypothetical protein
MGKKKTVAAHLERVSPLLNKIIKSRVDLTCATCIEGQELAPAAVCSSLVSLSAKAGLVGLRR